LRRDFEVGPIRPPSEAESLLLRITRNCPWNKCKFCSLYRGQKFSTRSVEEIKADIDAAATYGYGWESCFLQDANTMVLAFDKLREILTYLREKLPGIKRVTSYGRVDSLAKFSVEQLAALKEAGLDRIHSGYETGSDRVLALINKGYTKAQEIEAGQKVKASGIELSVYFMPGVGGKELSQDNAIETADVISKVNPDFVRIRTFVPHMGSEIQNDIDSGIISNCSDIEKAIELKTTIENIKNADGRLISDHIINLFEDVNGSLATDKEKMLAVFDDFFSLEPFQQKRYQLARRMGWIRSLSHMELLTEAHNNKIDTFLSQLDSDEKFEAYLLRLLRHYI